MAEEKTYPVRELMGTFKMMLQEYIRERGIEETGVLTDC